MKFALLQMVGFFMVLTVVHTTPVFAQSQQPVTKPLYHEVVWAGVDRPGDLFVVLVNGDVIKFNKDGARLGSYSFGQPPALFEPMDGVQSFFFQSGEKRYGNLASDLSTAVTHDLDPSFAIAPSLVCPSLHELWILDAADLSLKKTKMKSLTISLESALQHLPDKKPEDYTYMREYQNYLFLLDVQSGVHMFNSLGKFIRTLGVKHMKAFNFLGEEIYFLEGDHLTFIDLYTQEMRSVKVPSGCLFALVTDDRLYAIGQDTVTFMPFKVE